MTKLSPALKELINASFSRPGPAPAPAGIKDLYLKIAREAGERKIGPRPWLAVSAAATITLNSPDSLSALYAVATGPRTPSRLDDVPAAEFIREVGLKCISFNGIPRSINVLGAFRASLPDPVGSRLETRPSRGVDASNIGAVNARGRGLWDSVYTPFEAKLVDRLAHSHPDLPVHILGSHYGPLLSDPEGERGGLERVGRVLTSVVAIACLRAQGGVGPQVLSHVFGLHKAVEQGFHEREAGVEGAEWLAGDEGSEWLLRKTDEVVEAIGGNFATREAKL
ncbi:Dol-P-Man [Pleurostoma richardsiae]|uniref:Dol-P-Man n=1 Tax=Pleurostoma richardsiae TaxID=41990 RepID=A0AA38RH32_9PEZI|nr:Dol-P-Man [Pleurostoma richardsiae]